MVQRRRFSAEYKRETVAMLESPGVSVSQIAAELGLERQCWGAGDGSGVRSRRRRLWARVDRGMSTWPSCGGS